jgi:hypothetical protein
MGTNAQITKRIMNNKRWFRKHFFPQDVAEKFLSAGKGISDSTLQKVDDLLHKRDMEGYSEMNIFDRGLNDKSN